MTSDPLVDTWKLVSWENRSLDGQYARLVIFKVGPVKHATIEGLVDEFDALYRAQKGFRHVFIIGDKASGEYGSFSVWESKEDAEAANAVIAPRL